MGLSILFYCSVHGKKCCSSVQGLNPQNFRGGKEICYHSATSDYDSKFINGSLRLKLSENVSLSPGSLQQQELPVRLLDTNKTRVHVHERITRNVRPHRIPTRTFTMYKCDAIIMRKVSWALSSQCDLFSFDHSSSVFDRFDR